MYNAEIKGSPERPVFSYPPSPASSRSSSPAPHFGCDSHEPPESDGSYTLKDQLTDLILENHQSGKKPMDVYEATLPKWRAGVRRALVKSVQWESTVIADMQVGRLVFFCYAHEQPDDDDRRRLGRLGSTPTSSTHRLLERIPFS